MTNLNYLSAVVVVVVVAEVPLAKHVTGGPSCPRLSMGSDHDWKVGCPKKNKSLNFVSQLAPLVFIG